MTTTQKPINEPTKPTEIGIIGTDISPAVDVTPDIDDTVEIIAGPPPTSASPIGDCGGRLFIAHKDDCSKYLMCNFGQLSEQSCPNGLLWNEDRCDWPENTKCENNIYERDVVRNCNIYFSEKIN